MSSCCPFGVDAVATAAVAVASCSLEGAGAEREPFSVCDVGAGAVDVRRVASELPASAESAADNAAGSSRPRFAARRMIPAAAFGLKKNLGAQSATSTSAKDVDTPPPLGHSEVSAVQHSPGEVVKPELGQRREKDSEISAAVAGKKSGNVLNEEPASIGENSVSDSGALEEEAGSFALEAGASSGDGEVLAGEASADEVNMAG